MDKDELHEELSQFGKNLAFLRKRKGWSQENISDATDISQSVISDYEKGQKFPSLERALKIAMALDVSLGEMVDCDLEHSSNKLRNIASEEWKGTRRVNHPLPLERFTNITLYIYYYSDTDIRENIRRGEIKLEGCFGEYSNFILGEIETNSQKYSCKLIIEHPKYIYIFGDNKDNPERIFIALHEPRYSRNSTKYKCGIGIAVSEGSSQGLYTQKILITDRMLDEKYDKEISNILDMDTSSKNGYTLTIDDDKEFYRWYKNNFK